MNTLTLAALLASVSANPAIAAIVRPIVDSEGKARFASFTYTNQQGETSRYNIQLGFSYHELLKKSLTELELMDWNVLLAMHRDHPEFPISLLTQAHAEKKASIEKSLAYHEVGEVNPDYTKKDLYLHVAQGFKINSNDLSLQCFGLLNSKVVLVEGEYPKVNSRPLTLAKKLIEKTLAVSKFREFALENLSSARINGEILEFT
jgi:hypothetical protein